MTEAQIESNGGDGNALVVTFSGDWLLGSGLPDTKHVLQQLQQSPGPTSLSFNTGAIGEWDTGLIIALLTMHREAVSRNVEFDGSGLPDGARRLLDLAFAVAEREGARRQTTRKRFFERVGDSVLEVIDGGRALLTFTGELVLSLGRYARGTATYLRSDLLQYIQEAGAQAFVIVSVISFLIGMIFAFVGVMQLNMFGAGIYTADLVAIAMVREMAPIMTAIIMAGRTGAAYAAQIGTMKVNEEIDALQTLGMQPIDFLVTPRVIALVLMMPLLTMYASLMGIIGGMMVGVLMLDISLVQYVAQTESAVGLNSLFGGLFKSIVYGSLVAACRLPAGDGLRKQRTCRRPKHDQSGRNGHRVDRCQRFSPDNHLHQYRDLRCRTPVHKLS
jgi:phospholipid/cholesterol/gamma-HCH transport system permease protein